MKKVVKKMANGGAKKSYVPTPGMAYKEKGRANQLAMATGIPAGSKSVKPKAKTPRLFKDGTINGTVTVGKAGRSVKYKTGDQTFDGKKGFTSKSASGTITYTSKKTGKKFENPAPSKTPAKTLTKLPEVTVTAKRKESTVAPKAKTVTKPISGSATNKSAGKTVAQMWQEKTGTSWSEAKKQGLTDGSAKGNMKLMAKMKANPETFTKRDPVPEKLPTISLSKTAENLSPAKPTPELAKSSIPFKAGKSRLEKAVASKVGQMKKGGMVKKKK